MAIGDLLPGGGRSRRAGGLFGAGGPAFFTSRLDALVNWSRANSLWPMPFGTACCAIELMAAAASDYDLARFGMERLAHSPRQADVLICAGRVPYKLAPVLRRIWDQMTQPKWCISMGACASTGGVFDAYSMVQGIDTIMPVDVYIPGCPPRPEQLIYGLMMIQEKVREETLARHYELRAEDPASVARPRGSDEEIEALAGPFGNSTQQDFLSHESPPNEPPVESEKVDLREAAGPPVERAGPSEPTGRDGPEGTTGPEGPEVRGPREPRPGPRGRRRAPGRGRPAGR
ncbi:MAG TPA: NADH-quinone oxidoreductase subunit NuoB [Longimicrobiales bacterium]|nr:NADH-quinone oxidoreductase subunit NuoB [Longimicrobiales bacterium]